MTPRTQFTRLLWKEYRQVRTFGFVLLGCGMALQSAALPTVASISILVFLALVMSILFAVASSATAFSSEYENGTFLFQRVLPTSLRSLAAAKIGVAMTGATFIFLTLWIFAFIAWTFSGRQWISDSSARYDFSEGILTLTEFLVFGTMFSLIERRPLVGLAKAVALIFAIRGIGFVLDSVDVREIGNAADVPWCSVSLRLISLALGIALAIPLVKKWYADEPVRLLPKAIDRLTQHGVVTLLRPDSVLRGEWQRLLWLQFRVSIWPVAVFTVLGMLISLFVDQLDGDVYFYPVFATLLLGVFAFQAAKSSRSALAAFSMHPTKVWFSQLAMPAIGCLGVIIAYLFQDPLYRELMPSDYLRQQFFIVLLTAMAAFTWGQLASLRSRTVLGAIGMSICFAIPALLWFMVVIWAEASFWLFALPLLIYPLMESFLRSRRWFADESRGKFWWLARVGLYIALAQGLIIQRAYEIPGVTNQQVAAAFANVPKINREQADRFRKIGEKLYQSSPSHNPPMSEGPDDAERRDYQWVKVHQGELSEILNPEFLLFALPESTNAIQPKDLYWRQAIEQFLVAAFHVAVREQNVELGERILKKRPAIFPPPNLDVLRWCLLPTNSSKRVRLLAQSIQDSFGDEAIYSELMIGMAVPFESRLFVPGRSSIENTIWFFAEGTRWNRWVRFETVRTKKLLEIAFGKLRDGMSVQQILAWYSQKSASDPTWRHDGRRFGELLSSYRWKSTWYRGLILQLAAMSWQMDHGGELPKSLDDLKGHYLKRIPLDPSSGESFGFVRNRWPVSENNIYSTYPKTLRGRDGKLPPFLWSLVPPNNSTSGWPYGLQDLSEQELVNTMWRDGMVRGFVIPLSLPAD